MAKAKALVISGPMNAQHVGGINVLGGAQRSVFDSYFDKTVLEPDERPSHTYVATGSIEVPKSSDTVANTIRRRSVSLRRSYSDLRKNSTSHVTEPQSTTVTDQKMAVQRANTIASKEPVRSLRKQTSLSRLRQKVGLDRELYEYPPAARVVDPELEIAPAPLKKNSPRLHARKPLPRSASEGTSKHRGTTQPSRSTSVHREPPSNYYDNSVGDQHHTPASHQPLSRSITVPSTSKRPVKSERIDSGTAIHVDKVPSQQRPSPFQEIMAVKSLEERMALYKKTREYWAYADHGLIDWTGRASGPKPTYGRT
jgi:hypothetical protein